MSQRALAMETDIEVDKQLIDVDYIGKVAFAKQLSLQWQAYLYNFSGLKDILLFSF
ncbi:hypothetical protein [Chryseobacterium sp. MA9]|uniref:hypothetical protein n=1 Tax=Chryseobacterium sp. MA9 TaxID=2966625 RepID=UPI00351D1136